MNKSANKLLRDAEAAQDAQVAPQFREAYMRIVNAGIEVAVKGDGAVLELLLRGDGDPVELAAKGAVNLVLFLRGVSKDMPLQPMVPASFTLMVNALDLAERIGVLTVGRDELDRATRLWANNVMQRFGVPPQKLDRMKDEMHRIMQDPVKMELINRETGYVRDPRVSTPTISEPTPVPRPNRRKRRRAAREGR